MKRALAAVAFLVALEGSARAADPNASAMAEALFDQGRTLLEQGKVAEACDKFAASNKLDPAPGTSLNLADCYARLGRTASAWALFVEAAADARRDGDARREKEAEERSAALEPKLAHLHLVVSQSLAGLHVDVDGEPLTAAAIGAPLPVDPGIRKLHVAAPGYVARDVTVSIAEGADTSLTLPALAPEPPKPLPAASERTPFWSAPRVVSVLSAGVTVVCTGIGIGLGVSAQSKWNDATKICPGPTCSDPAALGAAHDAGTLADLSTGFFVGAGVFAVTSVVMWIVAPRPTDARAAVRPTPNGVSIPFY